MTIAGRDLAVVAVVEGGAIGCAGLLVDRADLGRFGGGKSTGALVAAHNAVRATAQGARVTGATTCGTWWTCCRRWPWRCWASRC